MANPNDAVGTNGAFGGRTSVNAFNDVLSAFSGRGVLSGWACSPSSGLTVTLGGDGSNRDVAIAEDASGNKTTINNISQAPVPITVNSAPASNARVDAIVAYIEDSPNGSGITDNPDVVNMLVVSGTVASSPVAPNDSAIRSAITADGASGSTAYYAVLAYVTIPTGTTDVDSNMITAGESATINPSSVDENSIGADKINFADFPSAVVTPTATSNINLTSTNQTIMNYSAPVSGKYLVLVDCYAANDSEVDVDLNLGSTNLIGTATTKTGYGPLNLTYLATVTAGQSLNVVARGSGSIFASGTRTHMVIARLG